MPRLIRFDGTLFVCMSSLSSYLKNGTASEFDLLECPHSAVKKDFYCALRDHYPAGTIVSSLAKSLLSVGVGTTPDPDSKVYYVPKVFLVQKTKI